jgi:hypothetical protein
MLCPLMLRDREIGAPRRIQTFGLPLRRRSL